MELTEENESVISVNKVSTIANQVVEELGEQRIYGEIVDPKCFFGVMKTGYGKIHRSCAIRCISGGIPPVLAIKENEQYVDYYFLTNQNGTLINRDVLEYVGKKVEVSGEVEKIDDWKNIKIDTQNLRQTISMKIDVDVSFCRK